MLPDRPGPAGGTDGPPWCGRPLAALTIRGPSGSASHALRPCHVPAMRPANGPLALTPIHSSTPCFPLLPPAPQLPDALAAAVRRRGLVLGVPAAALGHLAVRLGARAARGGTARADVAHAGPARHGGARLQVCVCDVLGGRGRTAQAPRCTPDAGPPPPTRRPLPRTAAARRVCTACSCWTSCCTAYCCGTSTTSCPPTWAGSCLGASLSPGTTGVRRLRPPLPPIARRRWRARPAEATLPYVWWACARCSARQTGWTRYVAQGVLGVAGRIGSKAEHAQRSTAAQLQRWCKHACFRQAY